MKERCLTTGVSIEQSLLDELDQKRREIGLKQGKDIPRSTYICHLLKIALKHERASS